MKCLLSQRLLSSPIHPPAIASSNVQILLVLARTSKRSDGLLPSHPVCEDILAADADWSMFDHYRMEDELTKLLAREVDLVSIRALEENRNPTYREEILDTARVIYAA